MPLFEPHLQSVFAGGTSATGPGIVLSNSNGFSFGLTGNTVTVSADYVRSISVSNTQVTGNQIVFGNANGIQFGAVGQTITASMASGSAGSLSILVFSQRAGFETNYKLSNAILSFQKVSLPAGIAGSIGIYLLDVGGKSLSSGAFSISFGAYSITGQTASAVATTYAGFSWTSGSDTSNLSVYGGVSGTRYRSFGWQTTLQPGDYMFGMAASMAPGVSAKIYGRQGVNLVGTFAGPELAYFLDGVSISSVFVLPASFAATDTGYVRTGVSAAQQPGFILIGTS